MPGRTFARLDQFCLRHTTRPGKEAEPRRAPRFAHVGQIDHDLDKLDPNLTLSDIVQDLYIVQI